MVQIAVFSLAMWFSIFYFCLALFRCLTTQEVKKQLQLAAPNMYHILKTFRANKRKGSFSKKCCFLHTWNLDDLGAL